jgi:ribosomal protein S18 acetylase RimI-like enzyme
LSAAVPGGFPGGRPDALPAEATLRRPTEADQPGIVGAVDQWFGSRRPIPLLARAWFRHFGGTSWLATTATGAPIGYLLAFRSPDRPEEAVLHLVAVDPNLRRRGIGRFLVARFEDESRAAGARVASAVVWPDEPLAVAFVRGVGYAPESGPGTQRLWGVPAWPDYDAPGEDRAVFTHALDGPG